MMQSELEERESRKSSILSNRQASGRGSTISSGIMNFVKTIPVVKTIATAAIGVGASQAIQHLLFKNNVHIYAYFLTNIYRFIYNKMTFQQTNGSANHGSTSNGNINTTTTPHEGIVFFNIEKFGFFKQIKLPKTILNQF